MEEKEDDVECKKWIKWVLNFVIIVDGLNYKLANGCPFFKKQNYKLAYLSCHP
jgi:hypothetical protein